MMKLRERKSNCLIRLVLVIVMLGVASICLANEYDDNPNYQFLYTAYQGKNYLELSSILVNEYNPPKYQLTGTTIHVSGDTGSVTQKEVVFRYNYDQQKAYSYDGYMHEWLEVKRSKNNMVNERGVILANALFRAAYGMNFYH
ncbi:hypothetical protein [Anaerosinus massiliensis]|uniref:hypothetical protein n=1 Tax=Massilibacillus massiliensis TaxID=1806837 RepID=UPI000DA61DC3|nr:hypothetical protein [Massilibacillus massiliensis]